ncbi:ribokinase [Galbibacter pacificus]|uniref:Ribokinase n=1 Tax=Galbibacter pacificus TaxID=2996052 RepID=A0ABT6FN81_9FLAO|nr:ribokinase [Galbibacter pacificus]MDG3581154.1 ribokinase [Galbibacter pacificus]MDG3584632.1 ribokinase [Galbibacter pacificus]
MSKIVVIGSSNTDLISKMEHFPIPGETIEGESFFQTMGGKGANQALAAHKLGGNVQFVTSLGKDSNGKSTMKYYKRAQLDVSLSLVTDEIPSGTAMIWVDGKGENSIVINSGANKMLSSTYIDKIQKVIAEAYMVVLQLEIPYETVKRVCEIASRNKTKIFFNPAPAQRIDAEIIKMTDILVVNETEARIISGEKSGKLEQDEMIDRLRAMGAKTVILTLGKKGSIFKDGRTVISVPAFSVNAVDSTAAGDVFCGAIAAELSKGSSWENALEFATAASAISVTKMGAQPSIPTEKEVLEFLKSNTLRIKVKADL